jgi:hypothetical protein
LQYFPLPAMREWIPAAARGASAPDGFVGKTPLSILLGEGETWGVGVLFCAPATGAPAQNAATTSMVVVIAFIVYSVCNKLYETTTGALRPRSNSAATEVI